MSRYAVTLWPEWAAAIAWLDKRCENRAWRPDPSLLGRGRWVCIHAGTTIGGLKKCGKGQAAFEAHLLEREDALENVVEMAHRAGWSPIYDVQGQQVAVASSRADRGGPGLAEPAGA